MDLCNQALAIVMRQLVEEQSTQERQLLRWYQRTCPMAPCAFCDNAVHLQNLHSRCFVCERLVCLVCIKRCIRCWTVTCPECRQPDRPRCVRCGSR